MITLWLVELFANELAILRNNKQEYTPLQNSFKQFLLRPVIQVNIYLLYFLDITYFMHLLKIIVYIIVSQLCLLFFMLVITFFY